MANRGKTTRLSSRFSDPGSAAYHVTVVVLQLVPYSLAGSAGVNMWIAYFRPRPYYSGRKWFGIPDEAMKDVARIYIIAIPLFLLASLVEFLTRTHIRLESASWTAYRMQS